MALTSSGDVYTWGRGESGQLGHGDLVRALERGARARAHAAGGGLDPDHQTLPRDPSDHVPCFLHHVP